MMKQSGPLELTDLHCHILPGIDDGAQDVETSRALLQAEREMGTVRIAFTPHFDIEHIEAETFLANRAQAADSVAAQCRALKLETSLGAEVRMRPELSDMDLRPFCLGETDYLLLEWPFSYYPLWGEAVLDHVLDEGIRPVFAHIERYDYFWTSPQKLDALIERGVLCQTNATTLLRKELSRTALDLIRQGYIHIISSDTHNLSARPPRLREAYAAVQEKLGAAAAQHMAWLAADVFHGKEIATPSPPPRKKWFGFF